MSTLPNTAVLFPDWKQEINRRVAAHKIAKGASQAASAASTPTHQLGQRAAKAAARVAARYAAAPSYSEMLAREARAAMDAAKAAAKAAEEAQAAFQFVLDGLEAAPVVPEWQLEAPLECVAELDSASPISELLNVVPEPATHSQADQQVTKAAREESEIIDVTDGLGAEQAVQPIYANLIEFPRPMIAARRARPRLAEGPLAAAESAPQLSIFEVEPTAISTVPPPATEDLSAPPSWMRTQWPESIADEWLPERDSDVMPLARHYASTAAITEALIAPQSIATESGVDARQLEEHSTDLWLDDEAAVRPGSALSIEVAPLGRRLLAVVVDGALSAATLVLMAFVSAPHVNQLPGMRVIAFGAMLVFLVAGFAYHACFFTLFRSTPGMLYAGIEIDTLSGAVPARRRRWFRLTAMLLSLLPLGLGFLWAVFDDDNLAWHDRLTGTYLRRR